MTNILRTLAKKITVIPMQFTISFSTVLYNGKNQSMQLKAIISMTPEHS